MARALTLGGIALVLATLSGCALGPVESDPAQAEARAAAMRLDCYRRGGTWSEESRTCVGADAIPRR
ncbi:hypothetical protein [Aquidulcibacter sp.]|jgi:hypothetical protein|uniref:hypothetical protein n=1 Tax=Aquidulcibacter sp. TaxID=2052990 RepID=UPI00078C3A91|nr:hypothetical protein AEM38_12130 [Hyphomonadaceae bacterium UKL13-1]OYU53450.1 MAG: hypothetical protein CFE27_00815 [Alphaproteobacteria bacterium PA1]HCP64853.1 hypothetical protein [Hyphomonadaceae bacterium]